MNINVNPFNPISKTGISKASGKSAETSAAKSAGVISAKADSVTISRTAQANADSVKFSAAITAEVASPSSAAQLAEIKGRIANGGYNVSASDVAKAILGDIFA